MARMLGRALVSCSLLALGCAAGCGAPDELELSNLLDLPVSIELRAPRANLRGGCQVSFATRFCREEFELLAGLDVPPLETRRLTLSDAVDDERCTNVFWMRVVRLGEVGPVEEPGTQVQLPATVEIERGPGAVHTVAFPQATVRLDEAGLEDANQAGPPSTCAELGRDARP
jgi:hypothetical protein